MAAFGVISQVQAQDPAYNSVTIGSNGVLDWFTPSGTTRETLGITQYNGGILISGARKESSLFKHDGGITLTSDPVRVVLGSDDGMSSNYNGSFEVWSSANTSGPGLPTFKIDTAANSSVFKGVNLTVGKVGTTGGNLTVEGTLTVGGSQVLTQSFISAPAFGVSTATGFNAFSTGTSTVASGNNSFAGGAYSTASGDMALAWGYGADASGSPGVAMGVSTVASGYSTIALGYYSNASGTGATALSGGTASGNVSTAVSMGTASGMTGFSAGLGSVSSSYAATTLGSYNGLTTGNANSWVNTDPVFTVGNGQSSSARSTALETFKNGQTALTNKYWNASDPLATVSTAGGGAGEALIVNGNTRLRGKVVIEQAQGDISMGIYAP